MDLPLPWILLQIRLLSRQDLGQVQRNPTGFYPADLEEEEIVHTAMLNPALPQ